MYGDMIFSANMLDFCRGSFQHATNVEKGTHYRPMRGMTSDRSGVCRSSTPRAAPALNACAYLHEKKATNDVCAVQRNIRCYVLKMIVSVGHGRIEDLACMEAQIQHSCWDNSCNNSVDTSWHKKSMIGRRGLSRWLCSRHNSDSMGTCNNQTLDGD